ncbi:ptb domain-containing engulfment adapter protein 1 [Plakobranchus ocellatus]|uniref:Ptb domain-containing engulfment adapter protein 1 n=1 Tax=Plakobranchus ocellatus TaxID=259542 RepID=A0AAV4BUQ4_9GAST|nr:ptb domain-containing engulfment adapter protein 1 [Plakobranchus ocellatus]
MPRRGSKTWQHPPDALLSGHILYTVKFLGECVVDKPKGTEVVKDAIRKMKFNKHIKRAEGQKPPKVELVISAEAVCILDPKSSTMMYRYPLHLISYCADDKSDKRMITFIAKEPNGNRHFCYVFDSEKCAEEITLTIGQAFDLAYKKFLESHSNEGDLKKQYIVLQKKVNALTFENQKLKQRIAELEKLKDRSDLAEYRRVNEINDLSSVTLSLRESSTDDDDSTFSISSQQHAPAKTVVGRRLENLLSLDDESARNNSSSSRHTNGTHAQTPESAVMPILSPPPPNTRSNRANSLRNQSASTPGTPGTPGTPDNLNPFYASPSNNAQAQVDPFGMQAFSPASVSGDSEQELLDIRDGFNRGLTFGTDDFNLDDLDPLNQKM